MSIFEASDTGVIPTWSLGDRIRKAREHAGMEQGDLAPLILKKRSTLSAWENGKHRPDELTGRAIAHYTGVSFDWLWNGTESGPDGGDSVTHNSTEPVSRFAGVIDLDARRAA